MWRGMGGSKSCTCARLGRPVGSRHKLSEAFLADVHSAWKDLGKDAVKAMAEDHPEKFCAMVAGQLHPRPD